MKLVKLPVLKKDQRLTDHPKRLQHCTITFFCYDARPQHAPMQVRTCMHLLVGSHTSMSMCATRTQALIA